MIESRISWFTEKSSVRLDDVRVRRNVADASFQRLCRDCYMVHWTYLYYSSKGRSGFQSRALEVQLPYVVLVSGGMSKISLLTIVGSMRWVLYFLLRSCRYSCSVGTEERL